MMRYNRVKEHYKAMDEDDLSQNAQETEFFSKQYKNTLSDIDYSILRNLKAERTRLLNDYRHNWTTQSKTLTR